MEKLNFAQTDVLIQEGKKTKIVHAVRTEETFAHVVEAASKRGMSVNEDKTTLLCMSDSVSCENNVFINAGGNRIEGGKSMKILGFNLTNKPDPNKHVSIITRRLRSKTWALRKLRRAGFTKEELVKFYCSSIRPTAEYASPAYHSMTPQYLSDKLEQQQTQALKNIYGWGASAAELRKQADLPKLAERRESALLKFAKKTAESNRFKHWFPRREGRSGRVRRPFLEPTPRTNSCLLYTSPSPRD